MKRAGLIFWTLLFAANAVAGPVVISSPVDPKVPSGDSNLPPAVFGGTDRKFDWSVAGLTMKNATLRIELAAVAGRLAMPLGKPVLVANVVLPGPVQATVPFPEVKTETDIVLRLSATEAGTSAPVVLGDLRFAAYPHDLADRINALLQPLPNGDKRLIVFGAGHQLRTALQAMRIDFTEGGSDLPGRLLPEQIYLGDVVTRDAEEQAHDRSQGARLAVFAADDSLPPGVYVDRGADGAFILVTLPILPALADDPRSQLALLKIIQSLTST